MDPGGIADICSCLDRVRDLRGDIVECGCYRCGTSVLMARYLRSRRVQRRIFACDTFEGFNMNELRNERLAGLTRAADSDFTDNSYDYVLRKTHRLGYNNIIIVRGLFEDTLDTLLNRPFCLALIDCDLSESAAYSANRIFPSLAKGGVMLFDDYTEVAFKGMRKVVDEFVAAHRGEIEEHHLLHRLYYVRKVSN